MGRNWLDGWTQRVLVNRSKYTWRPVTSRVPQGAVLRPVPLDNFVNNIEEVMECAPNGSTQGEDQLVHSGTWLPSRRTWISWRNGLDRICQNSTRTNAKSCIWEQD